MLDNFKWILILLIFAFQLLDITSSVGYELYDQEEFEYSIPKLKDWCYDKKRKCNEAAWSSLKESSSCNPRTHMFQSPINLPGNITHLKKRTNTKATHYLEKTDYILTHFHIFNTGRTLHIRQIFDLWEAGDNPGAITATINKEKYFFHSLHFHWGSQNDIGSEHAIDGRSFPIEVHLVFHHNDFQDMRYALSQWTKDNGILVIAIFLAEMTYYPPSEIEQDHYHHTYSNFLFPIVSTFKYLKLEESKQSSSPLLIRELFIGGKQDAYRYEGSLTTPPCRENVLWYILKKPVIVPIWHIREFRNTKFYKTGKFSNNFRSLKKLPRRTKCNAKNATRTIEIVTLHFKAPAAKNRHSMTKRKG